MKLSEVNYLFQRSNISELWYCDCSPDLWLSRSRQGMPQRSSLHPGLIRSMPLEKSRLWSIASQLQCVATQPRGVELEIKILQRIANRVWQSKAHRKKICKNTPTRREKIATGEGAGDCFATAHVFYIELSLFASGAKHATLVSDSKSGGRCTHCYARTRLGEYVCSFAYHRTSTSMDFLFFFLRY